MDSTAAVMRKTGDVVTTNGIEVPEWATVEAGVPFRLGGADRGGSGTRTVSVGETDVQLAARVGSFPAATTDLADDDLIEITAGENVGVVLKIVEATWQDQATARRVPVVEEKRPEEWA